MKKKIFLLVVSSLTLSMVAALSVFSLNSHSFSSGEKVNAEGTFTLDGSSVSKTNEVINATAINEDTGGTINLEIGGSASLENKTIKFDSKLYGYLTNLDPVRGIDLFTMSFSYSVEPILFASSEPLNIADIDGGMYPDLQLFSGTGEWQEESGDYLFTWNDTKLLNARYVLVAFYGYSGSSYSLNNVTYHTPCEVEPTVHPKEKVTDWTEEEKQTMTEKTNFIAPFIGNKSYMMSESEGEMGLQYQVLFFTPQAFGTCLNGLMTGYDMTMNEVHGTTMAVALQKKDNDKVYSQLISIEEYMNPSHGFYNVQIILTDKYPYFEQDKSWPTDFLRDSSHFDLIIPFTAFDGNGATYIKAKMGNAYSVQLSLDKTSTVTAEQFNEAINNIVEAYRTSGFDIYQQYGYTLYSNKGLIISLSFIYNENSKAISFGFEDYEVGNSFPVKAIEAEYGVTYPSYTPSEDSNFLYGLSYRNPNNPYFAVYSNSMSLENVKEYIELLKDDGLKVISNHSGDDYISYTLSNNNPFKTKYISIHYSTLTHLFEAGIYNKISDSMKTGTNIREIEAEIMSKNKCEEQAHDVYEEWHLDETSSNEYMYDLSADDQGFLNVYIKDADQSYIDSFFAKGEQCLGNYVTEYYYGAYNTYQFGNAFEYVTLVHFELLDGGVKVGFKDVPYGEAEGYYSPLQAAKAVNDEMTAFFNSITDEGGIDYQVDKVFVPTSIYDTSKHYFKTDIRHNHYEYSFSVYGDEARLSAFESNYKAEIAKNTNYEFNYLMDAYVDNNTKTYIKFERDPNDEYHLIVSFTANGTIMEQYAYSNVPNIGKLASFPAYNGSKTYFSGLHTYSSEYGYYESYSLYVSKYLNLDAFKDQFVSNGFTELKEDDNTLLCKTLDGGYCFAYFETNSKNSYNTIIYRFTKESYTSLSGTKIFAGEGIVSDVVSEKITQCSNLKTLLQEYSFGVAVNDEDGFVIAINPKLEINGNEIAQAAKDDGLTSTIVIDENTTLSFTYKNGQGEQFICFELQRYDWSSFEELVVKSNLGSLITLLPDNTYLPQEYDNNNIYCMAGSGSRYFSMFIKNSFDLNGYVSYLKENGYNVDVHDNNINARNSDFQIYIDPVGDFCYRANIDYNGNELVCRTSLIDQIFGITRMHDLFGDQIIYGVDRAFSYEEGVHFYFNEENALADFIDVFKSSLDESQYEFVNNRYLYYETNGDNHFEVEIDLNSNGLIVHYYHFDN